MRRGAQKEAKARQGPKEGTVYFIISHMYYFRHNLSFFKTFLRIFAVTRNLRGFFEKFKRFVHNSNIFLSPDLHKK